METKKRTFKVDQNITFDDFKKNFYLIKKDIDTYRLGQYFITLFIKNETDQRLEGLWEQTDESKALEQAFQYCNDMNWDLTSLRVLREA